MAGITEDITENTAIKEELRHRIEEKETLLQEVLHRVKNNLQVIIGLLNMQSRKTTHPEASDALNDAVQRIHTMALIHEQLYGEFNLRGSFSDYVDALIDNILGSHLNQEQHVEVDLEIAGTIRMDVSDTIACGLIINELVTNALKHAFGDDQLGLLSVSFFTDDDGKHHLVVADDGSGMDPSNLAGSDTLGFNLVRSLARSQLHGEIEASREDGLNVEVTFPPSSTDHD